MARRKPGLVNISVKSVSDEFKSSYRVFEAGLFDGHIGNGQLPIRDHWPAELKRRLAAALLSSHLGIGLAYALKSYVPMEGYDPGPVRIDHAAERFFTRLSDLIHRVYAFEKSEESEDAEFFCGFAVMKALSTLQSAHQLAQQGYLQEVGVLARVALENLSRGRACLSLDDNFLELTTTQSLTRTRSEFPVVGKIYGFTSKFAHWHPDFHLAFIHFETEMAIISRSSSFKPVSLSLVAALYTFSFRVFADLMERFWPSIDLSDITNMAEEAFKIRKLLDPKNLTDDRLLSLHSEAFALFDETIGISLWSRAV